MICRLFTAAAYLLVSLVPSQSFRANYRAASLKLPMHASQRELNGDAQIILHTILNLLLHLLRAARVYTDILVHGPSKLSAYFGLMTYCMVTKAEKLMVNFNLHAMRFMHDEKLTLAIDNAISVESIHSRTLGIIPSSPVGAQRSSSSQ